VVRGVGFEHENPPTVLSLEGVELIW